MRVLSRGGLCAPGPGAVAVVLSIAGSACGLLVGDVNGHAEFDSGRDALTADVTSQEDAPLDVASSVDATPDGSGTGSNWSTATNGSTGGHFTTRSTSSGGHHHH